jgi:hypothetical protein
MFREHQIRINYAWILNDIERCALCIAIATRQTTANLAQRMRPSHLAKQHGHELAPTGETPRVPFGLVLLDRLLKTPARKQLQHLRENAAYFH